MKYLVLLLALGACDFAPHVGQGQFDGLRMGGSIAVVKEGVACSSSAFDNTRCEYTYYCLVRDTTALNGIQIGDAIRFPRQDCAYTLQDLKRKL